MTEWQWFLFGLLCGVAVMTIVAMLVVRKSEHRPKLRPGEVVTFYDSTGLIPQARLVVQEYAVSQDGRQMVLVGLEEHLEAHRVYPEPS